MTAQEIFNKVAAHLLKQGKRSARGVQCTYRGRNPGECCAVGCLIPDDMYDPKMDVTPEAGEKGESLGTGVSSLLVRFPHVAPLVLPEDFNSVDGQFFLIDLQGLHDNAEPESWLSELTIFAKNWGLSTDGVPVAVV